MGESDLRAVANALERIAAALEQDVLLRRDERERSDKIANELGKAMQRMDEEDNEGEEWNPI